jgi:hypothetical protein
MENDGIFYAHWEYITDIWYTLWSFGNFVVTWYIFPRVGILSQEKSGNPGDRQENYSIQFHFCDDSLASRCLLHLLPMHETECTKSFKAIG